MRMETARTHPHRHCVDAVGKVPPLSADIDDAGLSAQLTIRAHVPGDARHLCRKDAEEVHHRVDCELEVENLAHGVHLDLLGQVAVRYGLCHGRNAADLVCQVTGLGS